MSAPRRRRRTATHWGVYDVEDGGSGLSLRAPGNDPDPAEISDPLSGSAVAASRILRPMVRKGFLDHGPRRARNRRGSEPFVALDWEPVLDLTASELSRVRTTHGNSAIFGGSYGWASAGRFHHAQSQIHRFLRCFGGYTDSVNTYSMAAAEVILPHVIGQTAAEHYGTLPTWAELSQATDLVVAFGGLPLRNAQVNPGGVGQHLAREGQRACVEAGVEFVSISPIRDDSAAFLGARWLAPHPGTDTAVMLAMAHTIIAAELHDADFLDRCCVGFATLRRYIEGAADGVVKDADWASTISGLPAAAIRNLAVRLAQTRAFITVAWSLQRAHHGEQPIWMAFALAAIAGQLGRPGGGCAIGFGCEHNIGTSVGSSRVAALPQPPNPVPARIPVARISDLLLGPHETLDYDGTELTFPRIELVYWCGGNPFHHHQDLNRLRRAWQQPQIVIVHEAFWNPLARHADIVLPCTTSLEREDFAAGIGDRHLTAMHRVTKAAGQARDDYSIFASLAARLGIEDRFTEGRSARQWLEHLYGQTRGYAQAHDVTLPDFDEFWEVGAAVLPVPSRRREWQLTRFRGDPAGHPLGTPSGKLELASQRIADFKYPDCPGHPAWLEPAEWRGAGLASRFPLHLLSNQPRARLHSQYDGGTASQATKVRGREPVRLHPHDAAARAIMTGDVVRLFNDRGSCLAGAVVSDEIRQGVVQLSTGAWYDPVDPSDPNSLDAHGNPNVLTLDIGTSRLAQGPSAQTALVEIERYDSHLPPVRAFEPPELLVST
jgi:biotin/methionine sulfoxide reductase